jgi:hypothetical protein
MSHRKCFIARIIFWLYIFYIVFFSALQCLKFYVRQKRASSVNVVFPYDTDARNAVLYGTACPMKRWHYEYAHLKLGAPTKKLTFHLIYFTRV